jgi:hypothetical protein
MNVYEAHRVSKTSWRLKIRVFKLKTNTMYSIISNSYLWVIQLQNHSNTCVRDFFTFGALHVMAVCLFAAVTWGLRKENSGFRAFNFINIHNISKGLPRLNDAPFWAAKIPTYLKMLLLLNPKPLAAYEVAASIRAFSSVEDILCFLPQVAPCFTSHPIRQRRFGNIIFIAANRHPDYIEPLKYQKLSRYVLNTFILFIGKYKQT